jgi:hypothetical protein
MSSLIYQVLFDPIRNLSPSLRLFGFFPFLNILKRFVSTLVFLLATIITVLVGVGVTLDRVNLSTIQTSKTT